MKLLKHIRCTDTAIVILREFYRASEGVHYCKIRWFNIVNPANVFDMGLPVENVAITKEQMKDWKPYD